MKERLIQYQMELTHELKEILQYWIDHTIDEEYGGFVGKIDHNNKIHLDSPKGAVLNCRILWTFSAAHNLTGTNEYLDLATRAYQYINDHFIDKVYGGVYWTVDHLGIAQDTKKQVYALSFAVYALSEYYKATGDEAAKQQAIGIYQDIVKQSYDDANGGYIEALARDWQELPDLRLSAKDANERKSMNTHLHVLEGFSNLFTVWKDEHLEKRLTELVHIFLKHIVSADTNHLVLFFDDEWRKKSSIVSYGHDIEAAWLIQEAAEQLNDQRLLDKVKSASLKMAEAVKEGLDSDGGLWYELDHDNNHLIREKHSWPQAEAMIGFFNAYQLTGNSEYLKLSLGSWEFVKKHIRDDLGGEWYWGVKEDYSIMDHEDKVGIWKCPYHNTRACIELIHRIDLVLDKK